MRIAARVAVIVAAAVAGAALWTHLPRSSAAEPYRAPRTADEVPDLNGVWQALNTANYDIQAHAARPALAITPASLRNALTVAMAMGGSTNVALHSVEIAREDRKSVV